jgi:hypothetical protein
MRMIRRIIAGLLLAACPLFTLTFAQVPKSALEVGIYAGSAVRNYPDFPELTGPAMLGYAKYSQRLAGNKTWHQYYRFPYVAVQLTGGSLGNDAVLGYMAGATGEFRFPLTVSSRITFSPILGMGVSWFSDPYDETSNPENFIIGSPLTFLATAAGELSYSIDPTFDLLFTGTLMHSSNAHYQLPNVGLNLPAFGLGVRYKFGTPALESVLQDSILFNKKLRLNIRLAIGFNEQGDSQGPVNGPKYPIYLGSIFSTLKVSPVNKLKGGIEVWYNSGVYDYIVSQEFYEDQESKRSFAVALMFGHEFLMGHFGLVTDVGLYLYNEFYQDRFKELENQSFREELKTYIPARIGFQYYLKDATLRHGKNLFAGIYIKSNMGQADFLETSLGYTF